MAMNKAKLKGDWVPLFFTTLRGIVDGLTGAVTLDADGGHGQHLGCLGANYGAFVHNAYGCLEKNTASLYKKSSELSVEYVNLKEKLSKPDEQPKGATASILARDTARLAKLKPQLQNRTMEIELGLSAIEESINKNVNATASARHEALAKTERRIYAYLLGASMSQHKSRSLIKFAVDDDFDDEADYLKRHNWSDRIRKQILENVLREVSEDAA